MLLTGQNGISRRTTPISLHNLTEDGQSIGSMGEPTSQGAPYITGKLTGTQKAKVALCYMSSCIISTFFLVILMICALFKHYTTRSKEDRRLVAQEAEKLSKAEKKLVLNLQFYIQLAGLDLTEHIITTGDGFNLVMHRIIDPNESDATRHDRYPVLLVHGLMQSSAAYCTSGENSIALTLFRNGYDVWLGNNRCGFKPSHIIYHKYNAHMWQWGMKEMATLDLPCMVDYVTSCSESNKLALVAHSQGTSQTYYALARNSCPELGNKVSCFAALSPAVYAGPLLNRWFLKAIRPMSRHTYHVMFGHHSFIGLMGFMHSLMPEKLYTFFGYVMFNYLLGWNDALWNNNYRNRQFIFSPVYVSAELMYWWLGPGGFADTGCVLNQDSHSWFDKSRLPRLAIFAPGRDNLCDSDALVNRLRAYEKLDEDQLQVFDLPSYSHLDVLWAADAHEQVAEPLSEFIYRSIHQDDSRRRSNVGTN